MAKNKSLINNSYVVDKKFALSILMLFTLCGATLISISLASKGYPIKLDQPANNSTFTNTPTFKWSSNLNDDSEYTFSISENTNNSSATVIYEAQTFKNYHKPDIRLKAGQYAWKVISGENESAVFTFEVN